MGSLSMVSKIQDDVLKLCQTSYREAVEEAVIYVRCYDSIGIEMYLESGDSKEHPLKPIFEYWIEEKDGSCDPIEEVEWLGNAEKELQSYIKLIRKQISKIEQLK